MVIWNDTQTRVWEIWEWKSNDAQGRHFSSVTRWHRISVRNSRFWLDRKRVVLHPRRMGKSWTISRFGYPLSPPVHIPKVLRWLFRAYYVPQKSDRLLERTSRDIYCSLTPGVWNNAFERSAEGLTRACPIYLSSHHTGQDWTRTS